MLEGARNELFSELIATCDGMLAPAVYARIYETAQRGGQIVEVGTAMGAATVALALGLRHSGKSGHVFTFDPMTGGPRRSLNSPGKRIARIEANLARYGVQDLVTVTPSDLRSGLSVLPDDQTVSVLMLDADGRIDRDLETLEQRLAPGCSMIIDDIADQVRVKRQGATYRIDSKMRLSWLLFNKLTESGKLSAGQQLVDTYFGEVIADANSIIDRDDTLEAYRQLVFQTASTNRLQRLRSYLLEQGQEVAPDFVAKCRRFYRRIKYRRLAASSEMNAAEESSPGGSGGEQVAA
ncbi:methyltransferase family protein [Novosphingobium sp. PhB165]|uniref:class I SAM-dependent methyltransferase n=1 Tax=Novosphingobium sp. PhB165 TaxID=2485105 RepID=UPI001045DB4C|nr:class I SAM-dependent methyltransferase [Novosphingobium sp. PhB165]TCM22085.1 methyltransferase family protein [Novosphingobium sp. PhB165]